MVYLNCGCHTTLLLFSGDIPAILVGTYLNWSAHFSWAAHNGKVTLSKY